MGKSNREREGAELVGIRLWILVDTAAHFAASSTDHDSTHYSLNHPPLNPELAQPALLE